MLVAAYVECATATGIFQAQHFFLQPWVLDVVGWAIRHSKAKVVANSKYVARQFARYANVQLYITAWRRFRSCRVSSGSAVGSG